MTSYRQDDGHDVRPPPADAAASTGCPLARRACYNFRTIRIKTKMVIRLYINIYWFSIGPERVYLEKPKMVTLNCGFAHTYVAFICCRFWSQLFWTML